MTWIVSILVHFLPNLLEKWCITMKYYQTDIFTKQILYIVSCLPYISWEMMLHNKNCFMDNKLAPLPYPSIMYQPFQCPIYQKNSMTVHQGDIRDGKLFHSTMHFQSYPSKMPLILNNFLQPTLLFISPFSRLIILIRGISWIVKFSRYL